MCSVHVSSLHEIALNQSEIQNNPMYISKWLGPLKILALHWQRDFTIIVLLYFGLIDNKTYNSQLLSTCSVSLRKYIMKLINSKYNFKKGLAQLCCAALAAIAIVNVLLKMVIGYTWKSWTLSCTNICMQWMHNCFLLSNVQRSSFTLLYIPQWFLLVLSNPH